jgi:hypothetical protein
MLEPHDFRHALAMEILEHEHDFEAVREMLCHERIGTGCRLSARPQTARRGSAQSRVWSGSRSKTSQRASAGGRAARPEQLHLAKLGFNRTEPSRTAAGQPTFAPVALLKRFSYATSTACRAAPWARVSADEWGQSYFFDLNAKR